MPTSGVANDAAYFEWLASRSSHHFLRHELHEVVERYRFLASIRFPQNRTDPAHWKFRAKVCRMLADQSQSRFCRDQLYRLAATHDALAGYVRRRCSGPAM